MSHPIAALSLILAGLLMRLSYLALRGPDPEPELEEKLPPPIPMPRRDRADLPPPTERLSGENTRYLWPRDRDPNGPPLWGDGLD